MFFQNLKHEPHLESANFQSRRIKQNTQLERGKRLSTKGWQADFLAATIHAKRYCPSAEGKQLVLQCHS